MEAGERMTGANGNTPYIQVITTTGNKEDAKQIARTVLEERLGACVQISGCDSFYWWQGAVASSVEYVCVIKSRADLYARLEKLLTSIHPYEVPEIIVMPITSTSPAYRAWLEAELHPVDVV